MTICFFIMSANASTAPSASRFITSSMMRWYAISCRPSSAAMMPQILASCSSPCSLANLAVFPCEIFVARSWKDVYTNPRYGLFSVLGFMPAPMRFWIVVSTGFIATRPVSHRYLFIKVAVSVLLGGPRARPARPRASVRARLVLGALQRVEHVHVRGKRLLGDHVPDQHDQVVVGDVRASRLDRRDLVQEIGRLGVGKVILRLPVRGRGLQELQELCRVRGECVGGRQGTRTGSGGGVSEGARARDRGEKRSVAPGDERPRARGVRFIAPRAAQRGRSGGRRGSLPRARGVGSGRARTSFSAKSSMSMITSRLCAVRPAILDAASPSTMIVGESTAVDLGVHSLEDAREDLAPALALFGRAADANTALLATQEAIFSACEEKRTATCALRYAGVRGGARDTSNRNLVGRRHCFTRGRAKNSSREPSMTSRFGFSRFDVVGKHESHSFRPQRVCECFAKI